MKNIIKSLLVPVMALAVLPLMTSCETDDDSNPTLQTPETFVLNTPAYAGNVYDLANSTGLNLTTSQPAYGFPAATVYEVQVSIDPAFKDVASLDVPENISYTTMANTCQEANMTVVASELNSAVVSLYQLANGGASPSNDPMPVYIRLVAHIYGSEVGYCYSNVIELPQVVVSYVAEMPKEAYVAGPSIRGGGDAKKLAPIYNLENNYYGMVYMAAGSTLKWGANADTQDNGWTFTTVDDQANAGLSEGADGGIAFANAGWYALQIAFSIEDNSVRAKLTVYPGTAYVTGHVAAGAWNDPDPNWALTAPADASGEWVSPAFATGGELRAYIKIPGTQWWQTEFTLYDGNLYFRNANIVDSWSEIGSDYAVTCTAGQKLYVDFDNDMGRVE